MNLNFSGILFPNSKEFFMLKAALPVASRIGFSGVAGYVGAKLFTNVNPVNGALVGAVACVIKEITTPIFHHLLNMIDYEAIETRRLVVFAREFIPIALAAAVCTALGFPVSFSAALILMITQTAISNIGGIVLSEICKRRDITNAYWLRPAL